MTVVPPSSVLTRSGCRSASLEPLIQRFGISPGQAAQLTTFGQILCDDPLAPTAIRTPAAVRDDHLADSLVAFQLDEVRGAHRVVDLGAGAGLPGIVLAVMLTGARVWLLEANTKKCAFMRGVIERLGLVNAEVIDQRVEAWRAGFGTADLVTARAVAAPDVVLEYAAPLLAIGGAAVLWRGARNADDESAANRAASLLGLEPRAHLPVSPYASASSRHLQIFVKLTATPARFPRREGVARKRPLGAAVTH